jgi:hypothetical protein
MKYLCFITHHITKDYGAIGTVPWILNLAGGEQSASHLGGCTPAERTPEPNGGLWEGSFFFVSWGGVRLSPLGTSATNWPILPAPDDIWWMWNSRWNENWQVKPKYSEKTCPSATLSTINPIWPDMGLNPGRRDGKPATNRLSYGTARMGGQKSRLDYVEKRKVPYPCWELKPLFSVVQPIA